MLTNLNIYEFPECFCKMPLSSLHLDYNKIETIPQNFANLTRLCYFCISNNELIEMPDFSKGEIFL